MSDTDTLVREFLAKGGNVEYIPSGVGGEVKRKPFYAVQLARTTSHADFVDFKRQRVKGGGRDSGKYGLLLTQDRAVAVDTEIKLRSE